MKLLLDTCTFLWLLSHPDKIPYKLQERIIDPYSEVFLSVISLWEAAVKQQLGKLTLPEPAVAYLQQQRKRHGLESLSLDEGSIAHLQKLPGHHRDPFDRMLVCQAAEHGLSLVTPDPLIHAYPIKAIWEL